MVTARRLWKSIRWKLGASFWLQSEDLHPSGAVRFSTIEDAAKLHLRVASGLAALMLPFGLSAAASIATVDLPGQGIAASLGVITAAVLAVFVWIGAIRWATLMGSIHLNRLFDDVYAPKAAHKAPEPKPSPEPDGGDEAEPYEDLLDDEEQARPGLRVVRNG